MNKQKIFPVFLMIVILSIVFISCNEKDKGGNNKSAASVPDEQVKQKTSGAETFKITEAQFDNAGMKMETPGMKKFEKTIVAAGFLNVPPANRAEVRSYMGGYLRSCQLIPGDFVKKGQFLISLDNLDYIQLQQEFLQAQQQLAYLKADYERKKTLADEKITAQSSRQLAESDYKSMQAKYEALRKKLQMINIDPDQLTAENISSNINLYAPINGYLVQVNATKGMYADPSDIIFEIINTDHLHVELKVFEKDAVKVKKGQRVVFRLPEDDTFSAEGEVFLVGKAIDESDRTVNVQCHLEDESQIPTIIGTYIEAKISVDTAQKFCLPTGSLMHIDGQNYVLVNTFANNEGYVFEKVRVDVGETNEDYAEIAGNSRKQITGKKILTEGVNYF